MNPFYVTTPIYYVNDIPHLGHAYTTIIADILARYHRARGQRVFSLTGTDEHGQKIERAARAQGEQPIELADRVVSRFKETWTNLDIRHDDFIRTTESRHREVVHALWRRMAAAGDIYLGEYDGLYCVACEEYYTEGQLEDGKCPVHETEVEHLKQPSYFFRMSRYQDRLLSHIENNPGFIRPEIRKNEIVSFVKGGLWDLSISRTTFDWGIPVPDDPEHVIYVWVDALTNYISALGGFEGAPERYDTFWPVDVHLIGKDILRHHAVYWPTMLMSAGLPLPRCVFAHGWWTINGKKMSKSLRNVVEPNMVAADIGRDALRYFVTRETPLGNDGDFSHDGLFHRINSELANDLGNLLNRSVAMARRYVDGKVPRFAADLEAEEADRELIALGRRVRDAAGGHFDAVAPSRALETIWELVRGTNKYIDTTAPYKMIKDPDRKRRVEEIVANFLEALRWISLLVAPVMPDKAAELRQQLGLPPELDGPAWPGEWGELAEGLSLQKGPPLFPRIDDDRRAELVAKWTGAGEETTEKPVERPETGERSGEASSPRRASGLTGPAERPETITFDEFCRLDLRVAEVVSASRVEGTKKLLQIRVSLGDEERQIVAGIAAAYAPEELLGRRVIFVANLEPATIRGIRSEGMLLAAGEKKVLALSALDREVAPGTKVR
jgi:methionyl-tRNA synthetase